MQDKNGWIDNTGWNVQRFSMVGVEVISVGEVIGGLMSNTAVGEG